MLPRITVENARPGSLEILTGLWHRTWYASVSPEAHHAYRMRVLTTPWARRACQVLALAENGAVRSGMIVLSLPMRLNGRKLKVAGVAAVVTDPEHRGRGLAARLIAISHRRLADAGHDAAMLFTEIGTAYYAKLGYTSWPITRYSLEVADAPAPGVTIRPATARDVPAMVRLSAAFQQGYPLAFERTPAYLRHMMSRARGRDELFAAPGARVRHVSGRWIAEAGGEPVAYARVLPREGQLAITEAAFAPGRASALARLAVERARAGGFPALSVAGPASLPAALALPVTGTQAVDKMMMAPLAGGLSVAPVEHCFWSEDWF